MKASKPKRLHLWVHQNYRFIRNWLMTASIFLMLILNVTMLMQLNAIGQDNKKLLEAQQGQLDYQAKQSKERKEIAQRNLDYTFCGFQQFSQYTRDRQPISDLDLEQCTRGTTVKQDQTAETQNTPTPNASPGTSLQPAPQTTTPPAPSQPTSSAPPEPENLRGISIIDSTLKLLGL